MPHQACALTRRAEAGPSRKSASRVWTLAMQCRHRQTESRASHSSLMELPNSSRQRFLPVAKRIHSAPFVGFARPPGHWPFIYAARRRGFSSRPKEFSCCTAPFLNPSTKTSCSACARREACEMAERPLPGAHAAAGSPAPARPKLGTKLLIAAQWGLTVLGIFCLVGAAVVIAITPSAWPL